jgi:hydroxymethylpyrimidine/phosphomethylpyrimidine kinase
LLPLADWVTPNLDELALLTGRKAIERPEMLAAAQQLQERIASMGGRRSNVLAKGGHLNGPLNSPDDLLLTTEGTPHWLTGERIKTTSTHGTGCALSSALLSRLVLGDAPVDAAGNAKNYVTEALRRATPIGHGRGPMNLLWPMR